MIKNLQRVYYRIAIPCFLLLIAIYLGEVAGLYFSFEEAPIQINVTLLVLATCFSLVFPIWLKLSFIQSNKKKKSVGKDTYFNYAKRYIILSVSGFYIVPVAYIFQLSKWIMFTIALFAIYSLYFYYPSEKRIESEKKLFRVKE